MARPLGPA